MLEARPGPGAGRHSWDEAARNDQAMEERFTTFIFTRPLPMNERIAKFPHCAHCCATFYLECDKTWHEQQGLAWPHAPAATTASDESGAQQAAPELDDDVAEDDPYMQAL